MSLVNQINKITNNDLRNFFEVTFSSIIITKSGGVSLALDLAHTRPHKAKIIMDRNNQVISTNLTASIDPNRLKILRKTARSPLEEFEKRVIQNLKILSANPIPGVRPEIRHCDSQTLALADESIDLIVTSPPYASNAIDYMRAHKFSLVWFGYSIDELTSKRTKYIGGEATFNISSEELPRYSRLKVEEVLNVDKKRGEVLRRYYLEMTRVLKEMFRVLKPQKAAILVVGSSIMKGVNIEVQKCLSEIGENIGFVVPQIGVRRLDRNKRMMPAGIKTDLNSQIQQRMHEEYVIGFYKP
jgi:hypothetical protein